MLVERTIEDEMRAAVRKIQEWINSGLEPSEIAVLYRANAGDWVANLVSLISQSAPVYWPHDRSRRFEKRSGVCVRTMHSAKGLQWRAVLLVRVDMMPFMSGSDANSADLERLERGLMYVAMTRAEDMLAFTRSTSSGFGSRIQQLLHRDSARVEQ
jgi:superfamily I DNA/RNA helicase